jgi:hypothetical protein
MNWNCLTVTALLPAALAAVTVALVTVALATVVGNVDAAASGLAVPESDPPQPARRTAAAVPATAARPRRCVHRIGSLVMPGFRTTSPVWMKKRLILKKDHPPAFTAPYVERLLASPVTTSPVRGGGAGRMAR